MIINILLALSLIEVYEKDNNKIFLGLTAILEKGDTGTDGTYAVIH